MLTPIGINAMKQYGVNLAGAIEELSWSLYDFQTYAAAGQTELTFFQTPQGQGTKTLADTNMVSAGTIPAGQNFLAMAIAIEFFPGGNPFTSGAAVATADQSNDVYAVMKSGYVEFNVGSKLYIQEGPIGNFPQAYRVGGHASAASTIAATGINLDNASIVGQQHALIPLTLTSNQNFSVKLKWPTAVALPSTVAGRIGVRLLGRLFRNAQ